MRRGTRKKLHQIVRAEVFYMKRLGHPSFLDRAMDLKVWYELVLTTAQSQPRGPDAGAGPP